MGVSKAPPGGILGIFTCGQVVCVTLYREIELHVVNTMNIFTNFIVLLLFCKILFVKMNLSGLEPELNSL